MAYSDPSFVIRSLALLSSDFGINTLGGRSRPAILALFLFIKLMKVKRNAVIPVCMDNGISQHTSGIRFSAVLTSIAAMSFPA